ncbi:hypothetical protein EVAR_12062_1 [Eumeta japonica]|uniref:Uncharacterized protein n=1 Tax=Eumeta variegata TaxID=151549 RepID=A0A4C1U562_EUMVA|nr:hypothetical protein EVAR_12062_1 [Eumeta japonica]
MRRGHHIFEVQSGLALILTIVRQADTLYSDHGRVRRHSIIRTFRFIINAGFKRVHTSDVETCGRGASIAARGAGRGPRPAGDNEGNGRRNCGRSRSAAARRPPARRPHLIHNSLPAGGALAPAGDPCFLFALFS